MTAQDWREQAHCKDKDWEVFYTSFDGRTGKQRNEAAKRLCARCPVWKECLMEAVALNDFHGVRGGMTGVERARAVRRRRARLTNKS